MVSSNASCRASLSIPAGKLVLLGILLAIPVLSAPALSQGSGSGANIRSLRPDRESATPLPKHPYNVDDLLKIESLGKAKTSPDGRWIVWEQKPPYDMLGDYSLETVPGSTGARLMVLDTRTPGAVAKPLFSSDGAQSHGIDSFSPDSRYLTYFRALDGVYSMGVFDFETGKTQVFDAAPNLEQGIGTHRSAWISPHEFAFAALPPGGEPVTALRGHSGKLLWRDWNAAWHGGVSVNELESHASSGNEKPLGGRLVKVDLQAGKMTVLADGLFNSLAASPDGHYLAALRQFSRLQSEPGVADHDWTTSRSQLQLFDLDKHTSAIIAADKDVFPKTLEWAPDRDRLTFFAWKLGAGVRSGLFQNLDARSGGLVAMPHNGLELVSERDRGQAQKPERPVWIGGRLAVFAREYGSAGSPPKFTYRDMVYKGGADQPGRADWFLIDEQGNHQNLTKGLAEPNAIPLSADGRSIVLLAGGKVWRVAPDAAPVNLSVGAKGALELTDDWQYARDHLPFERFVAFIGQGAKGRMAVALDTQGGPLRQTQFPSSSSRILAMSGQTGVALFRTTSDAGTTIASRRSEEQPRELLRLNAHMAEVEQTTMSVVHYSVDLPTGKRDVDGCMILPPGYQKGHRYPVIVHIYPGVGASSCTSPSAEEFTRIGQSDVWDLHLLAARGYIVLQPNTQPFLDNKPPNPVGGMPHAVDAALDALISRGYADPDRIGLIGISQGGYASLWLATQMKRLKAVVSLNGWADMYSERFDGTFYTRYYADQYPPIGDGIRYEIGGDQSPYGVGATVWDHPELYVRNGPLFNARSVTAPLMLIHSDMDGFNLNQYEMMFTALYEQKKEARLLRYAGEGHGVSSPGNIRHMWNSIFDWFDRYLGTGNVESSGNSGSTTAYVPTAKVSH